MSKPPKSIRLKTAEHVAKTFQKKAMTAMRNLGEALVRSQDGEPVPTETWVRLRNEIDVMACMLFVKERRVERIQKEESENANPQ